ncbi:MAG TPA: ABC transporter ATP-binding protein [Thermosynechococcus sp. M98_K2018_005]|uniref:ABC transporter ATP-binding protein n=1 Tax=Thermosynechococcus sp. M98_K2018_005 TaxID=2747811 RepID=UPI0019F7E7E7|nr:ABC transporter ATP-binding protein [Thermosynechococcus sp. M98_K2018_005]HIK34897.1 ABC transporter ATP-binding protein [Thermosynechococcus sp. M98_K2018_005]
MHLDVQNVSKVFLTRRGRLLVLDNVNLYINSGEFVCVLGASGSGKTTLLRIIAGLEQPSQGHVTVDGKVVTGPGSDRGLVFQTYTLYPWLTVQDNIEFGLKLEGLAKGERRDRVRHYLDIVGLGRYAHLFPHQLSGGMKQRVAIARALVTEPQVLLMDEPFGALDAQTKEMMHEFLLALWHRTRTTILMITHDVEEAVFLAQRIYVLTSSPGHVKQEVVIDLPSDRTFSCKRQLDFVQQANASWILCSSGSIS